MIKRVKKIIVLLLVVLFLMGNSQVWAYSIVADQELSSIPILTNSNEKFGGLKRISYVPQKKPYLIYESLFGVNDKYEDKVKYIYDLYEHSKYADIMIKEIEKFRINAGEKIKKKFLSTENSEISQTEATSESLNIFASYQSKISQSISTVLDGLKLGLDSESDFKVTGTNMVSTSIQSGDKYSNSIQISSMENYENNRNTYAYVRRGFRQKYKVLVGVKYKINYSKEECDAGIIGASSKYEYTVKNYQCEEINIYLVPVESPYYAISNYFDNLKGELEYGSESHENIIFL